MCIDFTLQIMLHLVLNVTTTYCDFKISIYNNFIVILEYSFKCAKY